mgnify:CR=1 FL=1
METTKTLEDRIKLLRENGFEISPAIEVVIKKEIEFAVRKEIMDFMYAIQERANTIPPNLILNEVVNYAHDRIKQLYN